MQKQILQVAAFMRSFQQPVRFSPASELDVREAVLRFRLTEEEYNEFQEAFTFCQDGTVKVNRAVALDGLADRLYVLLGDAVSLGLLLYLPVAFRMVHESNMTKLWTQAELDALPDQPVDAPSLVWNYVKTNSDRCWLVKNSLGKVIKSPSYKPANLGDLFDELDGQSVFNFDQVESAMYSDNDKEEHIDIDELYETVSEIEEDDSY
jgi:hypothetical protein